MRTERRTDTPGEADNLSFADFRIIYLLCQSVAIQTDTHSQFYPQYPTAVSSAHSSKSHKPTSWQHCAWKVNLLYPLYFPLPGYILCYAVHLTL